MNIRTSIERSFSQALQDVFAYYVNQYSDTGFFVDLGCNHPFANNNSAFLEQQGWKGILADFDLIEIRNCHVNRKNRAIFADLTKTNITDLLTELKAPAILDYLSIDLDNDGAWICLQNLDFNKFTIKALTFEHDAYRHGSGMRNASRDYLAKKGLKLVCADVAVEAGKPFEDWYVNPVLVPESVYKPIESNGMVYTQIFKNLIDSSHQGN